MSSKMEKLKSTMMLFVIKKRKLKTEAFESMHCFPFQP